MLRNIGRQVLTASQSTKTGQKQQVVAQFGGPSNNQSGVIGGTTSGARASTTIYDRDMLDGFVPYQDPAAIRRIARDIYDFDPISGMAVEIISKTPFSQFEISGLPDQKMTNIYAENLNAIDVSSMAPEMVQNYMVDGEFVGSITEENNLLTGIVPIDVDACEFTNLPLPNKDPIIDVKIPSHLKELIRNRDERVKQALEHFGNTLEDMAKTNTFKLDPQNTIYFPRRTMATVSRGTSYFKRIIPVWLVEKALIKGTIDLAHRRQQSLLHLMIGDEDYLPDQAQLGEYADLFRRADADPLGAIVATRPQVQTNELRAGGSFWRPDESGDWFVQQKLRGLGISESVLSSEITVDTTTNVMTLFLDMLRSLRENFTRKIFYHKILLLVAIKNDFKISNHRESITSSYSDDPFDSSSVVQIDGRDRILAFTNEHHRLSEYHLPKIQWHKALKPEGNQQLMTDLQTLSQQGLPIPLRIWAVAAGVSVPELLRMTDEDVTLRKKLAAYQAKWPQTPAQQQQALQMMQSEAVTAGSVRKDKVLSRLSRPKFRNFNELEMRDPQTKRILSRKGTQFLNERSNRIIAEATSRLNSLDNARTKAQRSVNKKYHHSK